MKKESIQTIGLIALSVLYNYFFWEEKFGINLLIFSSLIIITLIFGIYPSSIKKRNIQISVLLTFGAASMVVYQNTFISKLGFFISFTFLVGFLHQQALTTVFMALGQYLLDFFYTIKNIWQYLGSQLKPLIGNNRYVGLLLRNLHLLFIPVIIFSVFFLIFLTSNPIFREFVITIFEILDFYIQQFFEKISLQRIIFLAFGIYLIFSILFSPTTLTNTSKEDNIPALDTDFIEDIKTKNEFKMALMLLVSVNILVFVVNVIDINFLWLNFDYSQVENLSRLVHEGTYTLILSILLSIAILLYYFREGLNFYPKNQILRLFAFAWIAQNIILAISVCIRNSYYIGLYGLTYKRIGVYVFLLLTIIGLLTLFVKIRNMKSFYYLLKVNTWAWYFVLITTTFVNWDISIARHNLANQAANKIDWSYLLSLSDRVLPLIQEYPDKIPQNILIRMAINEKRINYLNELKSYSWLSWNFADYEAVRAIYSKNSFSVLVR